MMLIRDAVADDLPSILAIHNDAIQNSVAIWTDTPVDLAERAAWLASHARDGFPVLVAVADAPPTTDAPASAGSAEHLRTSGASAHARTGADAPNLRGSASSEAGGGVLGYASLSSWRAKSGFRHTVEDSIYLRTDATGQGIGRLLLGALLERAREGGYHVVVADIEAGNAASIRLHESFGFENCGTVREVGTKFDRWLDLTTMRLPLT